jgi:hypothetical protein
MAFPIISALGGRRGEGERGEKRLVRRTHGFNGEAKGIKRDEMYLEKGAAHEEMS